MWVWTWNWVQSNKAVLAALTSLVVAVTGLIHAIKEPGAVKTYDRLKTAVEAHNVAIQQNHDDLVRVRDWIDELRKADKENLDKAMKSCSDPLLAPSPEASALIVPLTAPSASPSSSTRPFAFFRPVKPEASAAPGDEKKDANQAVKGEKPRAKKAKVSSKPSFNKPKFIVLPDTLAD
jgi:hypothetical protein